jgi:hypothetical protein
MPKQTTKQAAPAPQCQSAPEPYGAYGVLRAARLLNNASDESRQFFEDLMETWERAPYTLAEAAFAAGAHAVGYRCLGLDPDDKEEIRDLDTAARIFCEGEWLARFLRHVFRRYRDGGGKFDAKTPAGAFSVFESEMEDFHTSLETALEVLKSNPEVVADKLRELAQQRPKLFRPATA